LRRFEGCAMLRVAPAPGRPRSQVRDRERVPGGAEFGTCRRAVRGGCARRAKLRCAEGGSRCVELGCGRSSA
jgi:hypothetical protein